jgi:catechol 2,3-dioxygenase-like lactoylglutathione lyase family enzyme
MRLRIELFVDDIDASIRFYDALSAFPARRCDFESPTQTAITCGSHTLRVCGAARGRGSEC